jgi:hypothetical protein
MADDPIAALAAERARRVASSPPRAETAPKPKRGRPPGAAKAPLQKRLQEAFGAIGIVVSVRNEYDGTCILTGAERLSIALDNLAKQNPAVRRTLEAVLAGGAYGEVLFAVSAILLPIAANHGVLPEHVKQPMGVLFSLPTHDGHKPGDVAPTAPDNGDGAASVE